MRRGVCGEREKERERERIVITDMSFPALTRVMAVGVRLNPQNESLWRGLKASCRHAKDAVCPTLPISGHI